MINLFYSLLIIFIWNEFFYILNKKRLDTNFENKDIKSMKVIDLIYYLTRVSYWIFIIIGMFSSLSIYFILLFILGFIKFPIYHISKKVFNIYDYLLPILSILILISILVLVIIG